MLAAAPAESLVDITVDLEPWGATTRLSKRGAISLIRM